MDETDLIAWIRGHVPHAAGGDLLVGPGDDCAILRIDDERALAFAADALVDGVHFDLSAHAARDAGWKALCVNLSDIAAMGYEPFAATATVSLPRGGDPAVPEDLCRGLWDAASAFHCPVVGGDITTTPDGRLTISVAILGRGPAGGAFLRSGAKPGDAVFVTGALGGSIRGRHLRFAPRLAEAARLRAIGGVTAMIDVSDGLSTDLNHVARESGVGAEVNEAAIPLSDDARALADENASRTALEHALHDGEDFELLFTAHPDAAARIEREWDLETPLTRIGRMLDAGENVWIMRESGDRSPLTPGGFEHRL